MTSTMPRASGQRGSQSYLPSRWVALALLASAQLMLVLDVTVVNVALPDIGVALHLQRGVVLGGILPSEAGWRWVFTINVPIGVALLIAIPLAVPARPPSEATERRLDVPGAMLVTAGTAAAIYGLINVGSHGWAAVPTVLPLALAVAIWTVFALAERRVRRPQ